MLELLGKTYLSRDGQRSHDLFSKSVLSHRNSQDHGRLQVHTSEQPEEKCHTDKNKYYTLITVRCTEHTPRGMNSVASCSHMMIQQKLQGQPPKNS